MIDETRLRFLAAIAAQLPLDRLAEIHLFHGIRQGGMESGVAVLAVDPSGGETEAPEQESAEPAVETPASEPEAPDSPYADSSADVPPSADPLVDERDRDFDDEGLADDFAEAGERVEQSAPRTPPRRYTVFTARYRHTLKGPDRGKWEVSVTEEADAPLLTVDAVVRGVQRRSGDADEIVRLTGDEVRSLLGARAAAGQPA